MREFRTDSLGPLSGAQNGNGRNRSLVNNLRRSTIHRCETWRCKTQLSSSATQHCVGRAVVIAQNDGHQWARRTPSDFRLNLFVT
jgi:hypothetical protein